MSRQIYRRYQREFWPAMLAYIAIMFLLWPLLPRVHNELLKIALALLPVLPVLFVVRAMVRLVLGSDELEQRIHLIGLAIAATVVSTLSLAGGFLAAAGVVKLDGTILIWVWPTLVVVYTAGRGWASRRYGGASDVLCDNSVALYWRVLLVALAIAALTALGRHQLSDHQLGMLCGMSSALAAWGLVLAILHWRRRQRGDREAS
ncbi:hypothetical protein [Rhodanobacter sp. C03]|uniref:hypothetical protein n=1 Tax=Rhodanobacter sp. C03 TaxID=1945858 RepID=UPI000987C68E|nr:hypothetical protein [Rhodanobacter sp. C03]OOG53720.1 hypothetical protein B0E48_15715 [Rhodanobacter sp. C03]